MSYPLALLEQAHHLARRERKRPGQASLRRAVSTAYYAMFHLLIGEAVANWKILGQRERLARAFDHGRMRAASARAASEPITATSPAEAESLRLVARYFMELQDKRNIADYDNAASWSRTAVVRLIENAEAAFANWNAIRKSELAADYLFALFVKDRP